MTVSVKKVDQTAESDKTATTEATLDAAHKQRDPLVTTDNAVSHHINKTASQSMQIKSTLIA